VNLLSCSVDDQNTTICDVISKCNIFRSDCYAQHNMQPTITDILCLIDSSIVPCRNGWTNGDAVWWPKEPCIRMEPGYSPGRALIRSSYFSMPRVACSQYSPPQSRGDSAMWPLATSTVVTCLLSNPQVASAVSPSNTHCCGPHDFQSSESTRPPRQAKRGTWAQLPPTAATHWQPPLLHWSLQPVNQQHH